MAAEELKRELEYFEERKPELLKYYRGQYALIKGRELLGTYTTLEEAYAAGVRRLGNVPMLIKQVEPEEPVHHIPALTHGLLRAHP
jgi:hypothetical protein